ncbi:hypothetical protein ACIBO2_26190 [Nonomuraea sp. NPDC050022]|uniref:hypothetical protein n=1 Tax=Nonomuraea sp. NPDC050022 TaxID=3364358 RepID=UPI0037BBD4B7
MNEDLAHQTALALLRLAELDDAEAVRLLVDQLDADELRAVLLLQTDNLRTAFNPWSVMHGLSVVAVQHERQFGEVRQDYLLLRILRMAGAKQYREEE